MYEITDVENENVDVVVEDENGYTYVIVVGTPGDLLDEMEQEKTNFIRPGTPRIIVKKLTKEIVTEASNGGYLIKLYQFADAIDISVLNKLGEEHRKEWEFEEE